METIRICGGCAKPLAANAPEGLCPECLAKAALGSEPRRGPAPGAAPDPAQLAPQFPQLELLQLLGMGGMGMVYKARQTRLDRFVALKILPLDLARDPSFAERFNREARALARLNHPGIVGVYDFGQTSQYYYFVMEFVDGVNLRQLLAGGAVEPRQALDIVVQICGALQFAHDEGIVHRDIKPENILLNKKGQIKIADFGIAKLLRAVPDTTLTMPQSAMGTLNYMAPEQRADAQKVDHRADIYSLGVVFYEMLTGEVPMGRFEPPSKRVQVDVRLDEVVLRALERQPERRYQHASEVKTNVQTIASTMPGAQAEPKSASSPPPQPVSARSSGLRAYLLRTSIGVLALLALLSLGVAVCLHNDSNVSAALVVVVQLAVVLLTIQTMYFRVKMERARARGLWPQMGEIPDLEHVRRLAQAGEKMLAVKLYRRIRAVSSSEAKAVVDDLGCGRNHGHQDAAEVRTRVEKLQTSGSANDPKSPPPAVPPFSERTPKKAELAAALTGLSIILVILGVACMGAKYFAPLILLQWVALLLAILAVPPAFAGIFLGGFVLVEFRLTGGLKRPLALGLLAVLPWPLLAINALIVYQLYHDDSQPMILAGAIALSLILDGSVAYALWQGLSAAKPKAKDQPTTTSVPSPED